MTTKRLVDVAWEAFDALPVEQKSPYLLQPDGTPFHTLFAQQFDLAILDRLTLLANEIRAIAKTRAGMCFLHELVYPDTSNIFDRRGRKSLLAEGHYRISSPIYTITFMALALYGVLGGSFSRVGYTRRIVLVAATAGVVRILGFAMQSASAHVPALNILQYALPIAPIVFVCIRLYGTPRRAYAPIALTPLTASAGARP